MKNDFQFKKWRKIENFPIIGLEKGDSLTVTYKNKILVETDCVKRMDINEARIFEALVDDRRSIGGLVIEKRKK